MNFLDKYRNKKNIRFKSFEETLRLSYQRKAKTIVETGTARGKTKFFFIKRFNWKDCMSTPMFAEYAKFINGLALNNIQLDRKVLSDIAINDSATFEIILKKATS